MRSNQTNLNRINPYTAAAEKVTAAQRAASVRRKLVKPSTETESSTSLGEDFLASRWMDTRPSQAESRIRQRNAASSKVKEAA